MGSDVENLLREQSLSGFRYLELARITRQRAAAGRWALLRAVTRALAGEDDAELAEPTQSMPVYAPVAVVSPAAAATFGATAQAAGPSDGRSAAAAARRPEPNQPLILSTQRYAGTRRS